MHPMIAKRNKQIRGHILFLLNVSKMPTTRRVLELGMVDSLMVTNPDITEYLDYLEDRKYIEKIKSDDYGMSYYKLTSHGVDLIEGTTCDPGVILDVRK